MNDYKLKINALTGFLIVLQNGPPKKCHDYSPKNSNCLLQKY